MQSSNKPTITIDASQVEHTKQSPLTPLSECIEELEIEIKQINNNNKIQATRISALEETLEKEKSLHGKFNTYFSQEEKFRANLDAQNKRLAEAAKEKDATISEYKKRNTELQAEVERLKATQTAPKDKQNDEAKMEYITQMSRADEAIQDNKKLTGLYERALKDLQDKRKELQQTQQELAQLKSLIGGQNKPRPAKSPPITTASAFFTEKKSYNKDEKPILDIDKIFEI